jgi:hypothetical protein
MTHLSIIRESNDIYCSSSMRSTLRMNQSIAILFRTPSISTNLENHRFFFELVWAVKLEPAWCRFWPLATLDEVSASWFVASSLVGPSDSFAGTQNSTCLNLNGLLFLLAECRDWLGPAVDAVSIRIDAVASRKVIDSEVYDMNAVSKGRGETGKHRVGPARGSDWGIPGGGAI